MIMTTARNRRSSPMLLPLRQKASSCCVMTTDYRGQGDVDEEEDDVADASHSTDCQPREPPLVVLLLSKSLFGLPFFPSPDTTAMKRRGGEEAILFFRVLPFSSSILSNHHHNHQLPSSSSSSQPSFTQHRLCHHHERPQSQLADDDHVEK